MDKFTEFLIDLFAAPIVQDTYNSVKEYFTLKKEKKDAYSEKDEPIYELKTLLPDFSDCLEQHLNEINEWSKEVNLNNSFKPLNQTYVRLKFYLDTRSKHLVDQTPKQIELTELLKSGKHISIHGGPGSGKSTSMMFLCQEIFSNSLLFEENRTPIVIRFRELNPKWGENWSVRKSISNKILEELGIRIIDSSKKTAVEDDFNEFQRTAIKILNSLRIILILDGFDEISSYEHKRFYADEIKKFSINLNEATLIITSRTGDFQVDLSNTLKYEIAPLADEQIRVFISNWLRDETQSKDLFNQIKNLLLNDTAVRPLTLFQLCSIYDKSPDKKIPQKPIAIYSLVIDLLLKKRNESEGVNRKSRYTSFELDLKKEFLFSLAYLLTVKYNTIKFTKALLHEVYKTLSAHFSLPPGEVDTVLGELESHNGLFIQTGYDSYEFSHLSLQEYLTAEYIKSNGSIPTQLNIIEKIPSSLAIATAISDDQTKYFYTLIYDSLLKIKVSSQFIANYISRLAIERPDFPVTPIVSISLLTLLDRNIKILGQENKGNRDAIVKSLIKLEDDYKPIFNLDIIHRSLKEMNSYYKYTSGDYITKYEISVYFINLNKIKSVKYDFTNYYSPNRIIVPEWVLPYLELP